MSLSAAEADDLAFRDMASPNLPSDAPVAQPMEVVVAPSLAIEPRPLRPVGPALRLLPMPRRAESQATRLAWTAVAIGVAGLYLFMLLSYWSPANPGVDQNGYLVGGRQFAHTGSTGIVLQTPYDFIGRMWVTAPSGENYPKYPLGLPILYACAIWLQSIFHWNGYEVAQLVSPIGATFALLGIFAIVRRLADSGFAGVMAMLLLGTGQVMLTLADNPNSHAAGAGTILWGVYFLIRFLETGTLWRGLCAGFLLGFAYLIRYTDGMLVSLLGVSMLYLARWQVPNRRTLAIGASSIAAAVLVASLVAYFAGAWIVAKVPWLGLLRSTDAFQRPHLDSTSTLRYLWVGPLDWSMAIGSWFASNVFRDILAIIVIAASASLFVQGRAWWRLFLVGCAWLVPVVYQTVFNMVAMQSFTSYAGTNESTGFTGDDFVRNWELMVRTLHDQALFFIAPLGLMGIIAMTRRMPFIALLLALWFFPSVLLYTAYYWAPDNRGVSYSRFILTAIPALTIAASWFMADIMRRQGRTSWRLSPIAKTVVASLGVVVGLALLGVSIWKFGTPRSEPMFWALAGPGVMFAVAGAVTLVGRFISRNDDALAPQFRGWVPRLAVGAVVLVASGVSLYRTTVGIEWGNSLNARASIETQARQNVNLYGFGKQVRAVVPDGSVLFADGDRMHHFQWLGDWRVYFTEYFDVEKMKRQIGRTVNDTGDPDPIDPARSKYLDGVYKNKDQNAVRNEMNDLIDKALTDNHRVFYALTGGAGDAFHKTLDRRRFDVKTVGSYEDVPPPRVDEDYLPPSQRPRVMNRFGGARQVQANAMMAANERQSWRIVEVVRVTPGDPATQPAKPVPPATPVAKPAAKPAPVPTPKPMPTTKPATRPAAVTPTSQPATRP